MKKHSNIVSTDSGWRGKWIAVALAAGLSCQPVFGATVTGTLKDISNEALNTKVMFAPTNIVLVSGSGLSAGPPKTIDTAGGAFSIVLEAGDYVVSLPLIPWRKPFRIAVFETNGTINITNLLSAPQTYTYTNQFNCTVRVTADDAIPDVLEGKVVVAGSMVRLLETNGGAVTMILSNVISGDGSALTGLNASELSAGTVPDARLAGASPGFAGLAVSGNTTIDGAGLLLVNGATASFNGVTTLDPAGTLRSSGDIEITESNAGFVLKSANGTRYRVKVSDDGNLSTESAD